MKETVKQLLSENSGIPGNEVLVKKLQSAMDFYEGKKKKNYKEISKITCFGSLAYCCKTFGKGGKQCLWRSIVIDLLGLNDEKYEELKDEFDNVISKSISK